jgi:hypothetical protein
MHGPINVKSPNNISKWQMGINSAFIGLKVKVKVNTTLEQATKSQKESICVAVLFL